MDTAEQMRKNLAKQDQEIERLRAKVAELEEALRTFVDNSSIQTNYPHECGQAEELLEAANYG